MPQLSSAEQITVERMKRSNKSPGVILAALQAKRRRRRVKGPGKTTVYSFLAGATHARGAEESRGAKKKLTLRMLQVFNQSRKKLIKEAKNDFHVTWGDVVREGTKVLRARGLWGRRQRMLSTDYIAQKMRSCLNVKKRRSRARIARTAGEEEQREKHGKRWEKYPEAWWSNEIHGYIDNKKFVARLTLEQKKRARQEKITYHLRTPGEGGKADYIVPRGHQLSGLKSFEITACVAKDQIIFWRLVPGSWNGAQAADMYKDLKKALVEKWGDRSSFRIVEDGDRKGFQSGAGKDMKKALKLNSWTLPPRTPQWMPLDFSVWSEVETRVLEKKVCGKETLQQYQARVRNVALRLPKDFIQNCLAAMRKRIKATVAAKGRHTAMD